jgi:purine-binding chemotaxis protein CheW
MIRHTSQLDRGQAPSSRQAELLLIMAAGSLRCALPLSCVLETLRPLPLHPLAGTPPFVSGTSVIRGEPVPVVHLGNLVGAAGARPARLVVIQAGDHRVALAVDAVIGVRELGAGDLARVPPLLATAASDALATLATLDSELLVVLRAAHLLPAEVWPLPGQASAG